MEIKDVITFIQSVGFPIFVAVYVLIRLEKALAEISANLRDLIIVLGKNDVHIDRK